MNSFIKSKIIWYKWKLNVVDDDNDIDDGWNSILVINWVSCFLSFFLSAFVTVTYIFTAPTYLYKYYN
jgi:hypothetical protein